MNISRDSDRVDDLMDAMQDEKDIHDQISDAISRGHGDAIDDVSTLFLCNLIYSITLISLFSPNPLHLGRS